MGAVLAIASGKNLILSHVCLMLSLVCRLGRPFYSSYTSILDDI